MYSFPYSARDLRAWAFYLASSRQMSSFSFSSSSTWAFGLRTCTRSRHRTVECCRHSLFDNKSSILFHNSPVSRLAIGASALTIIRCLSCLSTRLWSCCNMLSHADIFFCYALLKLSHKWLHNTKHSRCLSDISRLLESSRRKLASTDWLVEYRGFPSDT